jgi:hypothetical protein
VAASLLSTSVAQAAPPGEQILVAKDTTTDAIAVYRRSPSGVCSKQVLPSSTFYTIQGTPNDDTIVVLSNADPVNFCGHTSILPFYLVDGGFVEVSGEAGMDHIWVGSTPAHTFIRAYGGAWYGDDTSHNYIYVSGPKGTAEAGSEGDYIVALNGANADGRAGNDVFCTGVSFLLTGPATSINGTRESALAPNERNERFGAAASTERDIQFTSSNLSTCDIVYRFLQSSRQSMLP